MKRAILVLLVALVALLVLAGCGQKEAEEPAQIAPPATAPPTEKLTYAIIPKMLNNPVFTLAKRGAEKAAKELGANVEVIYQASETGKAAEQEEVIRNLTNKGVTGMSISVVDANAVREGIDIAVDRGIITMTFDSDCPDSKRACFYAVSDDGIGQELGRQLVEACGGKAKMEGEVAIVSGQSSAPNLQARVGGVQKFLSETDFPKLKFLPILYCDDDGAKSIEQIRTTMQSHPKLRAIIMVGGWPLFLDGALDSVKDFNQTKVVSVDALPKQLDYVESGQVACLVAQKCFDWGYESVMIMENLRTGKQTYPDFVDSGYDLVFKEPTQAQRDDAKTRKAGCFSLVEYRAQWDKWNAEM